jgi:hypothetical protein
MRSVRTSFFAETEGCGHGARAYTNVPECISSRSLAVRASSRSEVSPAEGEAGCSSRFESLIEQRHGDGAVGDVTSGWLDR